MSNEDRSVWKSKRENAIKRFMKTCAQFTPDDPAEKIVAAIDAVVLTHIATKLEWENGPAKDWHEAATRSVRRLLQAQEKLDVAADDPELQEEKEIALDDLAMAHSAATFEGWSGPLRL